MCAAVTAEENVLSRLEHISKHPGTHVGLIIGQVASKRLFAIHIAPTPEQSNSASLSNLQEMDEIGLGEHSRYVTRLLPGGLWVLGAFVIGPDDIFTGSNVTCVKKILGAIDQNVSDGFPLHGRNPSGGYLILHYNEATKKYQGKISENSGGLKNIEWKFQNTTSNWCAVNTQYLLMEDLRGSSLQFPHRIKDLMHKIEKSVLSSIVHIAGKEWPPSHSLDNIPKMSHTLDATLLLPCAKKGSFEMKVGESASQIHIRGSIPSRVYLHPRCTVEEASCAVRQDIVRSLAARLEMHLDSLVEEVDGEDKDKVVHVPPRRVMLCPNNWKIQLSDYLFPGENSEETLRTCKELLDVDVEMDNIETDFEQSADSGFLRESGSNGSSISEKSVTRGVVDIPPVVIGLAMLTLIIALLFHLLFSS